MINTGYTHLDQLTGGFHNGELISIIGRPLMCRTLFALNLFKNLISEEKSNVVFLTSECPSNKIIKLLNQIGGLDHQTVAEKIIDVSGINNIEDFITFVRQIVSQKGANLIILDSFHYLGLFDYSLPSGLADATRRIKQLAKDLDVAIIMTSRTNYNCDEREGLIGMIPRLNDTNNVGDLAYYCDVVLGLYRPEVDGIVYDVRGYDLHDELFVFVMKSRTRISDQYIKYNFSPTSCSIIEKGAFLVKDTFF